MRDKTLFSLLTLSLLTNCVKHSVKSQSTGLAAAEERGTVTSEFPFLGGYVHVCEGDREPIFLMLERVDSLEPGDLGLVGDILIEPVGLRQDEPIEGAEDFDSYMYDNINFAIRFDLCFSEGEASTLKRVIARKWGQYGFGRLQPRFHTLTPSEQEQGQIGADALFDGDYSGIHMKFFGSDRLPSYLIRGFTHAEGHLITVSTFQDEESPLIVAHDEGRRPVVSVGRIVSGDPYSEFDRRVDRRDWRRAQYKFENENLSLEIVYDVVFQPGGYRTIRFSEIGKLQIHDRSIGLEIDVEKAQVEAFLEHVGSHHNLSDQFIIRDEERRVVYTLEKGPSADGVLKVAYDPSLNIPDFEAPIQRTLD